MTAARESTGWRSLACHDRRSSATNYGLLPRGVAAGRCWTPVLGQSALLALPYVGARRLEHLQYLVGDPLVRRFAGLARVPTARTVSNWLRRFTQETLRPLIRLNQELVLDTLARLDVPRLTLCATGWAARVTDKTDKTPEAVWSGRRRGYFRGFGEPPGRSGARGDARRRGAVG